MKIKKLIAGGALLLLGTSLFSAPMEVKRFGIFIGANDGGQERQRLLYAADDAIKIAQTMETIGGIAPEDSILLLDPDAARVRREMALLNEKVKDVESSFRRTEVMFYYSGHSDEQGLMIKEDQILYKEIRDSLNAAGADVVIAVLDSCSSGAITRLKGGQRRSPFLIDESSSMEGHAFLTSSSEDELSQESDRIGASFFTHYLISGLRGAADSTGDGRVTLNEIYQHTFDETLSQTESTIGGPQHPSYEIQLTGTGDLVLTDLTVPTSAIQLSGELEGRFSVRNSSGRLVAEFTKPPGDTLKLALPAGRYEIKKSQQREHTDLENLKTTELSLNRNTQIYLTEKDFASSYVELTRYRGDSQPETETDYDRGEYQFVFSPVPGVNLPSLNDNDTVVIQGGLIGAIAPRVSGVQGSFVFNIAEDDSQGVQAAYVFNSVAGDFSGIQGSYIFNNVDGEMRGIQTSYVFNNSDDSLMGIQVAGIFNSAGLPSSGIQVAGIFNDADEIKGLQAAGIFNYSRHMQGVQTGLVNIAKTARGMQIGLLNISREMYGLPIGLVNLSRNGIVDGGLWYEYTSDIDKVYLSFQSGTRYLYTLFYWGNSTKDFFDKPDHSAWGMHLGMRLPFGPLEFDIDGGFKQSWWDQHNVDRSFSSVPSARALVSLRGIGLFWGMTMDFKSDYFSESSLFTGNSHKFGNGVEGYHNFVVGFRM